MSKVKPIKTPLGLIFPSFGVIRRGTYRELDPAIADRLRAQLSISDGRLQCLIDALDDIAASWMMADKSMMASRNDAVEAIIRHGLAFTRAAQKLEDDDRAELCSIESWFPMVRDIESARMLENKLLLMRGNRGPTPKESRATADALNALLAAWRQYTGREAGVGYKLEGSAYVVLNELAQHLKIGRSGTLFTKREDFAQESLQEFREMLVDQFAYVRAVDRRQSQLRREKPLGNSRT